MKQLIFLLLFSTVLFFSGSSSVTKSEHKIKENFATCVGGKPCRACSSCNYCAHCNAGGGTCGVCSSSTPTLKRTVKPEIKSNNSSVSSQCKGTTKKGARCKRMVKGGGYCWQHNK